MNENVLAVCAVLVTLSWVLWVAAFLFSSWMLFAIGCGLSFQGLVLYQLDVKG